MEELINCVFCKIVVEAEKLHSNICLGCRATSIVEIFDIAAMEDMFGDNPLLGWD